MDVPHRPQTRTTQLSGPLLEGSWPIRTLPNGKVGVGDQPESWNYAIHRARRAHRRFLETRFMETSEELSRALVAAGGFVSNAAYPGDLAARIRLFAA